MYKDDANARNVCRCLMVLPLLPLNEVEFAFDKLVEQHADVLKPLFNYFDDFWMNQISIHLWNVSDLKPRINNNCEGKIISLYFS